MISIANTLAVPGFGTCSARVDESGEALELLHGASVVATVDLSPMQVAAARLAASAGGPVQVQLPADAVVVPA